MSRGVLLDRDGVLTPDLDRFSRDVRPLPGVHDALIRLRGAGWRLAVVTNQPWVARGVCTLAEVEEVNRSLNLPVDAWYVCPHHPHATVPRWRMHCECRKPRPGMVLRAAADLDLDLAASILIGDRPTDLEAGARAGCRTIRIVGGGRDRPRIITSDEPFSVTPLHEAPDLPSAVAWLLGQPD